MSSSQVYRKVRIVCISDTHNAAPGEGYTLPKGDILIHAGDLTNQGSFAELKKAVDWIERADFALKIVVAGNHDLSLDADYGLKHDEGWGVQAEDTEKCRRLLTSNSNFVYLQHSAVTVELPHKKEMSIRIFGSPYSPERSKQNWAFQYPDDRAESTWCAIPDDIDILITHTPPAGHCDASQHWQEGGCPHLLKALLRVRPLLHIYGHCHEGRGAEIVRWGSGGPEPTTLESTGAWCDPGAGNKKQSLLDLTGGRKGVVLEAGGETAVVNASIMGKSFGRGAKVFNKPIVVDLNLPFRRAGL